MSSGSFQNALGSNYSIFVSFFPLLYVVSGNFSFIESRKFLHFVYLITIITALTTIYGTYLHEAPCRELATPYNLDLDRLYKAQNIGGYGFIYYIVLLVPILLRDLVIRRSLLLFGVFLLLAFCVLRAEYTAAVLLFIVSTVISLMLYTKHKVLRVAVIVIVIIFALSFQNILRWAGSSLSDFSFTMSSRIEMMSDYNDYGVADGDFGDRQYAYSLSLNSFLKSPLFGNLFLSHPNQLGGHSEILDYLGHSGLFGLGILVFLIAHLRKRTPISLINCKDPFVKSLLIVAFILASINTFLSPELYYALLIIPLLLETNH